MYAQASLQDFPDELPHYYAATGTLSGRQEDKARRLVREHKVVAICPNRYNVLPIEGYNKTTYEVNVGPDGESCTCQYNTTKGKRCSHIMAVRMAQGDRI